jgi:hypothetical protein
LGLLTTDPDFIGYQFDFYEYPTTIVGFLSGKRIPSLQDIAQGLGTEIRLKFSGRNVIIICHSLGGLVVRQFALNLVKSGENVSNVSALLLATPNNGAIAASFGSRFSRRNAQLRQLQPYSEALTQLNDDWAEHEMDRKIRITYVAGGTDDIVSKPSAKGPAGRPLDEMLIGYDHSTIIRPKSHRDINYLLVKDFIVRGVRKSDDVADLAYGGKTANPLFDIYAPEHESYYVSRSIDEVISESVKMNHMWLIGASGVGKTAAIQRRGSINGWKVFHVMLASYENATPHGLLRAICVEIGERTRSNIGAPKSEDLPEILSYFRSVISELPTDRRYAVLVEEIPLPAGDNFRTFMNLVGQMIMALEVQESNHVTLIFSSIHDFAQTASVGMAKLRARVQFALLSIWSPDECGALIDMLASATGRTFDIADKARIVKFANGSPRAIKAVFRRLRDAVGQDLSLEALLDAVAREQV